jgi:predicted nucleotidyltransferase component of viral defense system
MEPKIYKTAEAFRAALEARLAALAASSGANVERLRQEAAFDRFLARLFQTDDLDYLLKGGYAMELRLRHRARFSRDLDLAAKHEKGQNDPQLIQTKLQTLAAKDLGDWFTFRSAASSMDLEGAPYAGYRFPIDARLSNRTFAKFHVDIAIGDAVLDDPVWVKGTSLLDFAGIPATRIPLLPVETHFAEKIHAYTRPRTTGLNSRVRDLIDLVLLLNEGFKDPDSVRRALKSTFTRRNTHPLPPGLPEPHPSWTATYAGIAAEIKLTSSPTAQDAYHRLSAYWKTLFPTPH